MHLLLYLFLVLVTITTPVYAKRYALVIGNSNYGEKIGFLKNPVNDANDMAFLLEKKNFNVVKLTNASQREMEQGISQFTKKLHTKDAIGLFFFAGHGMGLHGSNYLIPIGANINGESDVKYEAVDAERVMTGMQYAGNNLNMVILDACRNNPFARSFRSANRGLVRVSPPKGSLILYATSPGEVAADGSGRNGVFTQHLLTAINTPNANVEQVFKNTANKVYNATHEKQLPWQSGVILGEFYFSGKNNATVSSIKAEEITFWDGIKNETNVAYFKSYLQKYPQGSYQTIASLKIEQYITSDNKNTVHQILEIEKNKITPIITDHVTAYNNKDIPELLALYADNVDYFGAGIVTKDFILNDKRGYYKRWPIVSNKIIKLLDITSKGQKKIVRYLIEFDVYSPSRKKGIKGVAQNTMIISSEQGELMIVSDKQKILNKNKY